MTEAELEHMLSSGKMKCERGSHSTLCDCMDCSPTGSSVHGILQARILEWVAISSSGDLPDPGIEPGSSSLQADSLPSEPPGKEGGNKFSGEFLSVRCFTHFNTLTLLTLSGAAWVHLTFQVGVWTTGGLPYSEIGPVELEEQTQNCDPVWMGRIF